MNLNSRKSNLLNRAVSSSSGQVITFETSGRNHAGAAISGNKRFSNAKLNNVETIDLTTVLERFEDDRSILIKLDVEGAEIDAIKGIGDLSIGRSVTIIYEEVGADCKVTEFLESQSDHWVIGAISTSGVTKRIDHREAMNLWSKSHGPINLVASNSPNVIGDSQ